MSCKRKWFANHSDKSKKIKRDHSLAPGLKGFICTCNYREKECIREAYNILNEYADREYGDEIIFKKTLIAENIANIEDALTDELESLKEEDQKDSEFRRFQVISSGAKNCLFIRTTLSDPVGLAHIIMKDISENKKQKSRALIRMIPIEAVCKAYIKDITESAAPLFDKYFIHEGQSFSIAFTRHNNSNRTVRRSDIIEELVNMIKFRNSENNVDLKNPKLTVLVQLIRSLCCLSVIPDYSKLQKYNMIELCSPSGIKLCPNEITQVGLNIEVKNKKGNQKLNSCVTEPEEYNNSNSIKIKDEDIEVPDAEGSISVLEDSQLLVKGFSDGESRPTDDHCSNIE